MKTPVLEERMNNLIEQNSKEHKEILAQIQRLIEKLDKDFVPLSRFYPIERIVYGGIGLVLTAFVLGLCALVFAGNK